MVKILVATSATYLDLLIAQMNHCAAQELQAGHQAWCQVARDQLCLQHAATLSVCDISTYFGI